LRVVTEHKHGKASIGGVFGLTLHWLLAELTLMKGEHLGRFEEAAFIVEASPSTHVAATAGDGTSAESEHDKNYES